MFSYRRNRVAVLVLVCLCSLTLLTGSFLHDVIPHDHGVTDHHGQTQESPIWQDLHSALQHEKKSFALLTETFVLLVLSLGVPLVVSVFFFQAQASLRDPVLGAALRRGIAPHRMFR
jgi:hypothetical protein